MTAASLDFLPPNTQTQAQTHTLLLATFLYISLAYSYMRKSVVTKERRSFEENKMELSFMKT